MHSSRLTCFQHNTYYLQCWNWSARGEGNQWWAIERPEESRVWGWSIF